MPLQIKGVDKWILPVYKPYMLDYTTREMAFYGGAGSGKSYFVCQKMIIKALQSKRRVLFIRKVQATIKASIWDLMWELLQRMPQVVKSVNKTDMYITMINDSTFMFKGLDDSEKIKSIQGVTDIVIEEATEITLDDYTQLKLRLRSGGTQDQIHLMFNPVSKANWVYEYFFVHPSGSLKVCKTTYKDNTHLPQEYIDSILDLETKNPAYFRIYVLGDFATLDKLVFPVYEKKIVSAEEKKKGWLWVGMDFGYTNDPTAITWGYYVPQGKILYITGEYDSTGLTNDKIAEVLTDLGFSKEIIVADSAEPKSISELRKLGIRRIKPSIKGADSIINGIDKILRCRIIIDERCTRTLEEFENYTWQKDRKTGEYINRPIDTYNHHIDSIRYGIQSVLNKRGNADEDRTANLMLL